MAVQASGHRTLSLLVKMCLKKQLFCSNYLQGQASFYRTLANISFNPFTKNQSGIILKWNHYIILQHILY